MFLFRPAGGQETGNLESRRTKTEEGSGPGERKGCCKRKEGERGDKKGSGA